MRDTDLDSFRADAAPASGAVRAQARERLLDAIARESIATRTRTRRPRRLLLAVAVAVCLAVGLVIAEPWRTAGPNVARAASAMVSAKAGTILHIRIEGHDIQTPFSEQWLAADGSWRELHGGNSASGSCTQEWGFNASTHVLSTYDRSRNSVHSHEVASTLAAPIAQVRNWLGSNKLHAAGQTRIDGRRVTRLLPVQGQPMQAVEAYYIDTRTSAPVRWQLNAKQWYDFTIYERLPASAKNAALTSVRAQHPNAAQAAGSGASPGCTVG